jgi:RNA polymerase sigma-70 factor (ECF subfamily)
LLKSGAARSLNSLPNFNQTTGCPAFTTTHWSVVLHAGKDDSPRAAEAMAQLCLTYWYPLYAYLRRRGHGEHDAQDLTQGFFAQVLESGWIQKANPEKGRFRSFILASLNYFVADARDHAGAGKRGGGHQLFSLDAETAENRYRLEPVDELSPEKIFERRWATTLLDQVLARLAQEFTESGKGELFERLQPVLVEGTGSTTYAELGRESGMSEEAVKKTVQRMRLRYHRLFREAVAETVVTPEEVEDELRYLCAVLS